MIRANFGGGHRGFSLCQRAIRLVGDASSFDVVHAPSVHSTPLKRLHAHGGVPLSRSHLPRLLHLPDVPPCRATALHPLQHHRRVFLLRGALERDVDLLLPPLR